MNSDMLYLPDEFYASAAADLGWAINERSRVNTSIEIDTDTYYSTLTISMDMIWGHLIDNDGGRIPYLKSIDMMTCDLVTARDGEEVRNNFTPQVLRNYLMRYYGRY